MRGATWCRVGAIVIGPSHETDGGYCQDAGLAIERHGDEGPVLISVVSDGAGSATQGQVGSRLAVRYLSRAASNFVTQGGLVEELDFERIARWIDDVRDAIAVRAEADGLTLRDYSATLVLSLVSPHCAVVAHVGDGACILGDDVGYKVPSWPAHGEYASTTYFVTDDQLQLDVVRENGAFDKVAVFSDGLELLLLQLNTRGAFAPFFDNIFSSLKNSPPGRDRTSSHRLKNLLNSEVVTKRTDDDKTLLMACRVTSA
jgi:Protein phosphatase 2C